MQGSEVACAPPLNPSQMMIESQRELNSHLDSLLCRISNAADRICGTQPCDPSNEKDNCEPNGFIESMITQQANTRMLNERIENQIHRIENFI